MKGFILDIDGVLKRGGEIVPGSLEAVRRIIERGMKICYLTNNSTRNRKDTVTSLTYLGYPDEPVVSSAQAAARYILEESGPSRCLVVGETGLLDELSAVGHETVMAGRGEEGMDYVVAGLDRDLTYAKVRDALWTIRNGARFVATNRDPTLPTEKGKVLPGAGAVVAAIALCTGIEPVVVGKPEPYSTILALDEMGLDPDDVLMVGDRYDTDILAGKAAGCRVAMVQTGEVKDVEDSELAVFKDLLTLVRELP